MSRKPPTVDGLSTQGRIGAIDLTWELTDWEPLVDHYAIHASHSAEVDLSAETLIGKTVYGRFTHDTLGPEAVTRYYSIVTVDAAGRRSRPSRAVAGTSTASMVVTGTPIAQVGEFDSKSLELALAPSGGQSGYRTAFPNGVDFTYGTSDPARDWSYLHPGPSDAWGGRTRHTFRLRFSLEEEARRLGLAIWLIDTHASLAGTATISVNGTEVTEVEFRGGGTRGSLEGDATVPGTALRPSFVELELPAEEFAVGENAVAITKNSGSWHAYDAVGVFALDQGR
ncbi:polysaccharide lyase family protein [Marinactinospora thermotolerans]|uniref:Polysaccharide lyase family 4, domain III n=1 Tax=Marinactinospora thermotolerans DSM 45154 TaxID=1122192 RepID=A0A1T4S2E8_9ACTN|nr:polysaccharide lyase family protein [Marinactinospora thermotolerans]SKA22490.1 Polysaccharide lyase family 4, domain III [Marinactinospora thermotolerans DSM 45154]